MAEWNDGETCGAKTPVDLPCMDGIPEQEWSDYIGKNSSRYLDVFRQNEGKKWFFHSNLAALFFPFAWACYRKMYRVAAVLAAASLLSSLLIFGIFYGVHWGELTDMREELLSYADVIEEKGGLGQLGVKEEGDAERVRQAQEKICHLSWKIEHISHTAAWVDILVALPFCIGFGFLADCIYQKHALRCMALKKTGGVSVWSVIIGEVLYSLLANIVLPILLGQIVSAILLAI